MRRKAFTLIELLVVIAIIAILAAILFPVFARARERGLATASLSNARQIGMAMQMYCRDWDDALPLTLHVAPGVSWINTLQPYGSGRLLNRAPGDRSRNWERPMPGDTRVRMSSYAVSSYLTGYGSYRTLDRVKNPVQCIYVVEIKENKAYDHIHPNRWRPNGNIDPRTEIETRRYFGGAHYVFTDGHARWHRFEQTWTPASAGNPSVDWYHPSRG